MRTTVDLPDELFRDAKARAALEGVPLRNLIESGIRLALAQRPAGRKTKRIRFPLHRSAHPGTLRPADFHAAEAAAALAEDAAHAGPV